MAIITGFWTSVKLKLARRARAVDNLAAKRCAKIFDALLFVASLAIRLVRGPTPRTKLWAAKYTTRGYRRETNTRIHSQSAQS